MKKLLITVLALVSLSAAADHNWSHTKRQVYERDAGTPTFYCGCAWADKAVHWDSCGYRPRKNAKRAARTEIEHIVPAARFGNFRDCWKEGGREHCYKTDPEFKACHDDPNNVVVAIGEINGDRSARAFGEVTSEPRNYGACDFEIDGVAEPPRSARAYIAHVYIYMANRCGFQLTPDEIRTFSGWLYDGEFH